MKINTHYQSSSSEQLSIGNKIMAIGVYGTYFALAVIYLWFGGMKFTHYEAEGLVPLVGNSPILGWTYAIFSVDTFLACSASSRFRSPFLLRGACSHQSSR